MLLNAMPELISYTHCPCCGSASVYPALSAKDHTVSGEVFEIWHCDDCKAGFTQHVPVAAEIGVYYQSAAYVSHSDTAKGFVNRLYHIVRNRTLQGKRKLIQSVTGKQTGKLLDVGAGTGAFVNTMKRTKFCLLSFTRSPSSTANKHILLQRAKLN